MLSNDSQPQRKTNITNLFCLLHLAWHLSGIGDFNKDKGSHKHAVEIERGT